jgi:hypothetical protein
MLCYAGAAERGAGEEGRRRDEGTGDGAKEFARAAGGKAAGSPLRVKGYPNPYMTDPGQK